VSRPLVPRQRRNRTRQRQRLLELLRATDTHPTAAWLWERLRPEFPRVSLGTVYRNLEVLVEGGLIDEVAVPGGPSRYDANREPHHHFTCECCGRIDDVSLRVADDLARRVRRKYRLVPRRFKVEFYGLCADCTALPASRH
jgi:Fur family peroxide stress response transcriptional regulator